MADAFDPVLTAGAPQKMTGRRMSREGACMVSGCSRTIWAKGMCGLHYARLRTYGSPGGAERRRTKKGEPLQFAFQAAVHAGEPCLIWPYCRMGNGYAQLVVDGKRVVASRYICDIVHGPPPTDDAMACHTCGNGHLGCVNGSHVYWGDRDKNAKDMITHGRSQRGERHVHSKLTDDDVREIRRIGNSQTLSLTGARFGVCPSTVCAILKRRAWAWLDP